MVTNVGGGGTLHIIYAKKRKEEVVFKNILICFIASFYL